MGSGTIKLEIVFTIAAPALDIMFIGLEDEGDETRPRT